MHKNSLFPWQQWMAIGFGVLHLSPHAFWAMSPRELHVVLAARRGETGFCDPPDKTALLSLMHLYPDQPSVEK